jgi:hypothetical protein
MHKKEERGDNRKKGHYKLALRKASDIKLDAKTRFLDIVNKGTNKFSDIEKQLTKELNVSHGTAVNIRDGLLEEKEIITWQEKGITYVDITPFLPRPYKVALYWILIVTISSMILDIIIPGEIWQNYAFLFGIYSQEKIIVIHPMLPLALASSITVFFVAFLWRRSEKKNGRTA